MSDLKSMWQVWCAMNTVYVDKKMARMVLFSILEIG